MPGRPARLAVNLIHIKIGRISPACCRGPATLAAMRRNTRRHLVAWMIGVLLFTQWLTASYACPAVAGPLAGGGQAVIAQAVSDCHGMTAGVMDPENPSLCRAHCDPDHQAPSQASAGDAPAPAPMWFIVEVFDTFDDAGQPAHQQAVARTAAPPGWPPLYLIHGVLRN